MLAGLALLLLAATDAPVRPPAAPDCPPVEDPRGRPLDLVREADVRLRATLPHAPEACLPALALALGEGLLAEGDAPGALAPLVHAAAAGGARSASAFLLLGEAQTRSGDAFEALRSL